MTFASVLTCLWPGLPALWLRGQPRGLVVALVFAAIFNFALVATFLWPNWIGVAFPQNAVWSVIGVVWLAAVGRSLWRMPGLLSAEPTDLADEDLFRKAQTEYLKGHWVETESLLERMLRHHPEDPDARLMLATLYRHTKRADEAEQQLRKLQRQPGGGKWYLEIQHERKHLAHLGENAEFQDDEAQPDVQLNTNNEPEEEYYADAA